VTAFGLVGYVVMTSQGPGLDPPLVVSRLVSMALFAVAIHAFAGRLEQALVDAEGARMALAEQLAEVERLNERLTELDRAKDDFVSTVSHELRTPLTVILGLTGTLETHFEGLAPDRQREIARRIGANARGLEGIVATLLDLTRIERGGLDPEIAPVPLRAAVEESLDRLGPLLEQHPVTIDVPTGTVVRTDVRLLERVLDNLLSNAARHTAGGTAVQVRARRQGPDVRIEVTDHGPGVARDELTRLGEQFYRPGDRTDDGATEGIGLGLALVRDVLTALDSQLDIASEQGRGTTFSFVLPVASEDHQGT
jgi:signal transduction histidine kinase